MSEEELNEAIEYNLEYMEAMQSEEIFGGEHISQVELKYANKSIDRLQQENQRLKENNQSMQELLVRTWGIADDYKSRIEKAIEYIEKYDIFKEFNFPLMKRDEENQVKSSIDYQFKKDLKKNLLNKLQGVGDYE